MKRPIHNTQVSHQKPNCPRKSRPSKLDTSSATKTAHEQFGLAASGSTVLGQCDLGPLGQIALSAVLPLSWLPDQISLGKFVVVSIFSILLCLWVFWVFCQLCLWVFWVFCQLCLWVFWVFANSAFEYFANSACYRWELVGVFGSNIPPSSADWSLKVSCWRSQN